MPMRSSHPLITFILQASAMPTLAVVPEAPIEASALHLRVPAAAAPALAVSDVIKPSSGLNDPCGATAAALGLHTGTPRANAEPSLAATFSVDSTHMPHVSGTAAADAQVRD